MGYSLLGNEKAIDHYQIRYVGAVGLIIVSMFFLMISFIAATFAVLAHAIALVVSTCIIACFAFIGYIVELGKFIARPITDIIALDDSFEDCPQEARFVLVGKILASKALNKSGVQKIIEKAWRTEEDFTISPWGDNVYAFGFKNEDDLCRIISKSPWSVMGSILILRKWDQKKSFSELDFSLSPFWVQIHGLPLGFLNVKTGSAIAKSFGDVIAVEDPGERGRLANYLRIRVWLDVSKPLKKGFFLRRPKEDDLWVKFKYERLSDFCYGCGKISHTVNDCKERCSFAAKDWVYDGGIRAEFAVVETIQYGDQPRPRLVYPERKNSGSSMDEGGACSGVEKERVYQSSQNIPVDDLVENQGSRVVDCNSARTNPLGSATLQAGSNSVDGLSDDRSDLWNFEDQAAGTDFDGFDINCLSDLMDDRPNPVQMYNRFRLHNR
ncbi:hypothetical protein C3L33_22796, partial [Rhododendron williamsianum]